MSKDLLFTFRFRGAEWTVSLVAENVLVDAHAECHFNTQEILVERADWTKFTPRRIREIFWHELVHVINGVTFGALPDDEPVSIHCWQLDEMLAENISNALMELIPQMPTWLLNSELPIPFVKGSSNKRKPTPNEQQKS